MSPQACERSCFKALPNRLSSSSGGALLRAEFLHPDYTAHHGSASEPRVSGPSPHSLIRGVRVHSVTGSSQFPQVVLVYSWVWDHSYGG